MSCRMRTKAKVGMPSSGYDKGRRDRQRAATRAAHRSRWRKTMAFICHVLQGLHPRCDICRAEAARCQLR